MNRELEHQLVDEFPSFFREYGKGVNESAMHWGCACYDGWFDIIYNLCKAIQKESEDSPDTDFYFTQIKQKFFTLRIGFKGGNDVMNEMVDNAERLARFVCEKCGKASDKKFFQGLCNNCDGGATASLFRELDDLCVRLEEV